MIVHPHAKINLGLLIKGKRPDGYHEVETILYPAPVSDTLEVTAKDEPGCSITITGISVDGDPQTNLCVKAWQLLRQHHSKIGGVHLQLHKRIPAGAGLGGGSSDAAFTLMALRDLYDPAISQHELALVAAQLGADVPFFLHQTPCLATGTGTHLSPLHLHLPYEIRIVTPPVHSSTGLAYQSLNLSALKPSPPLKDIVKLPVPEWKDHLRNDFEAPLIQRFPEIGRAKAQLYEEGAVFAAMSGSGSAVFGLFEGA